MIKVATLLYKIDYKLNKVATFRHQSIPVENKIIALNEAQLKLVKNKVNPSPLTAYRVGFDGFKKRYQDIQILVEKHEDNPLDLEKSNDVLNKWVGDLSKLREKFMFFVDGYAIANKGSCKDRPLFINGDMVKHADVTTLLGNANQRPSFEYQETFPSFSGGKIEIYTDGTFDLTKAYISYIRYPKRIDVEGYETLEGNASINQDCELEDYLEDELVNLAIEELGIITENATVMQSANKRAASQE